VVTVNSPGGTPANRKVTLANLLNAGLMKNPYKFSAYHNTTQSITSGSFGVVSFNTENFDTNNNFSASTYTAPVAGFYMFGAGLRAGATAQRLEIGIGVNGTLVARGSLLFDDDNHSAVGATVQKLVQLSASDTVDVRALGNSAYTIDSGNAETYFWGYLVSIT